MATQRRRIVFLLPSLVGGGAERVIVMLLRHLDRSRFEPHLAVANAEGPYLGELSEDTPLHELRVRRVRYALPSLVRLVRGLRPAAVVSTFYELNLALLFSKPFLPSNVQLFVREEVSAGLQLSQSGRYPVLWRSLYRRLYVRADRVICVSDYTLNELAERVGIPRPKMLRIYNPVDVRRVCELADAAGNPYPGDGPHLVAAGRLEKQKGFDLLLEAMVTVHQAIPQARLHILGEGRMASELAKQRERLGLTEAVQFLGFQKNPYPYFRHADLFVLSSRYEGLPLVVLEALACGAPIVATDCPGGVREILGNCPAGLLVPDSYPQALAERIISACKNRLKESAWTAHASPALDRFRIEEVTRQYESLLSAGGEGV